MCFSIVVLCVYCLSTVFFLTLGKVIISHVKVCLPRKSKVIYSALISEGIFECRKERAGRILKV